MRLAHALATPATSRGSRLRSAGRSEGRSSGRKIPSVGAGDKTLSLLPNRISQEVYKDQDIGRRYVTRQNDAILHARSKPHKADASGVLASAIARGDRDPPRPNENV